MRNMIVVATRELSEKKMIFLGSLMLGIAVLATPLLPGVSGNSREITATAAFYLSLAVALGGAVGAGVSFIGRDLAENRIAFYFCRPLSAAAIWGGKLTAAFLMAAGCALLVQIPAIVTGRSILNVGNGAVELDRALVGVILVMIGVIAVGHHLSVAFRSRSAWLGVDMVAVPVIAFFFWSALAPFISSFAILATLVSLGVGYILLLIALLASGLAGLTRGRVQLQRVHRETSILLAILLAVFTASFTAWAYWVRSITLEDLDEIQPVVNHPFDWGPWVAIEGTARGHLEFSQIFLVDAASGRTSRVGTAPFGVVVSADGTRAVWPERRGAVPGSGTIPFEKAPTLTYMNLDSEGSKRETTIGASWYYGLSPSGDRVAIVNDDTLSVHELDRDQSVLSLKIPGLDGGDTHHIVFVNEDLLRIYSRSYSLRSIEAIEVSIGSRGARSLGEVSALAVRPIFEIDRLIGVTRTPRTYRILEASTMKPLATWEVDSIAPYGSGQWLCAYVEDGHALMTIRTEDGFEGPPLSLGRAKLISIGSRQPDGRFLVTLFDQSSDHGDPEEGSGGDGPSTRKGEIRHATLELVDLETGRVEVVARDLYPAATWPGLENPNGSNLFIDTSGPAKKLVLRDPLSGELKVVAGHS